MVLRLLALVSKGTDITVNTAASLIVRKEREGLYQVSGSEQSISLKRMICVRVCVCACVHAHVHTYTCIIMCACYSTHMDARREVSGGGSQFSSCEFCRLNMSSDLVLCTLTENHLTSNKLKHLVYPFSKINKSINKIA